MRGSLAVLLVLALSAVVASEASQTGLKKLTKESAKAVQDFDWKEFIPADERWGADDKDDIFADVEMLPKSGYQTDRWQLDRVTIPKRKVAKKAEKDFGGKKNTFADVEVLPRTGLKADKLKVNQGKFPQQKVAKGRKFGRKDYGERNTFADVEAFPRTGPKADKWQQGQDRILEQKVAKGRKLGRKDYGEKNTFADGEGFPRTGPKADKWQQGQDRIPKVANGRIVPKADKWQLDQDRIPKQKLANGRKNAKKDYGEGKNIFTDEEVYPRTGLKADKLKLDRGKIPKNKAANQDKPQDKDALLDAKDVPASPSSTPSPEFHSITQIWKGIKNSHDRFDHLKKQLKEFKRDGSLTFGQAEILLKQASDAEDQLRDIESLMEPFAPFDREKAIYPPGSLVRINLIEDKMRQMVHERKRVWKAEMSTMRRNLHDWGIKTPVSRGIPQIKPRGKRSADTMLDSTAKLLQSEDEVRESVRQFKEEANRATRLNIILGLVIAFTFILSAAIIICVIRCYRREKARTIHLRPKSLADVECGFDEERKPTDITASRTHISQSMPRLPSTQGVISG